MPWCENCAKHGLKKDEVVFDEKRSRVLCVPCGQEASVAGELPKEEVIDKTWFGVAYASDQGLKAEVVHGGAKITLKVDNDQIMRLLGQ